MDRRTVNLSAIFACSGSSSVKSSPGTLVEMISKGPRYSLPALGLGSVGQLTDRAEAQKLLERAEAETVNKQVEDLLKTDPAQAAALIRRWLEEG